MIILVQYNRYFFAAQIADIKINHFVYKIVLRFCIFAIHKAVNEQFIKHIIPCAKERHKFFGIKKDDDRSLSNNCLLYFEFSTFDLHLIRSRQIRNGI